jgi:hypothetical protein
VGRVEDEAEIDAEIQRQVETSAGILELPPARSSRCRRRRGWSPRSTATTRCSKRSRLPLLEAALSAS